MEGQWVTSKTLNNGEYLIAFQSYYENSRRISDKNRILVDKDNRPCMTMKVPNAFGNYYYRLLKECTSGWSTILDDCYLDMCAFYDDYDSYSDTYKDIHGVRPHYTEEQWDARVRAARKRGY